MTPNELKRIGRRLHGEDWQSPLGRDIGKHRITIWRWLTGVTAIPEEDAGAIRALDPGPKKTR